MKRIDLDEVDWEEIGDRICEIVVMCQKDVKVLSAQLPGKPSFPQIAAAASCSMIRERLEELVIRPKRK